ELLEEFAKTTHSAFARERALRTASRLSAGSPTQVVNLEMRTIDVSTWRRSIEVQPTSIAAFKSALTGYDQAGYGPKGTQSPLALPAGFPQIAYAGVFRSLVDYDCSVRGEGVDRTSDSHISHADVLLSRFQDGFGGLEVAGLEGLSQVLLRQGKARLFRRHII